MLARVIFGAQTALESIVLAVLLSIIVGVRAIALGPELLPLADSPVQVSCHLYHPPGEGPPDRSARKGQRA